MKVVAYLRVSTDDKGQDPERQRAGLLAWAERGGHEIVAWVKDEGTSVTTPPLQRQAVLAAIEEAEAYGATTILVESVDRWTRRGVEDFFASGFLLRIHHKLEVVTAATPPGMSPEMMAVFHAMQAAGAREYIDNMARQIKSGLALAKAKGWPKGRPGRPPKDPLTVQELAEVLRLAQLGHGRRKIAWAISQARGAFEVADPKARHRRTVTENWIRLQAESTHASNPELFARFSTLWPAISRKTEVVSAQGEGA